FDHFNFVGGFSASASMALTVTNEIFVTVEISKSSICSSWSLVNVPSRRLKRKSCARAMSFASTRAALVSSRPFTPSPASFLTIRYVFKFLSVEKRLEGDSAQDADAHVIL